MVFQYQVYLGRDPELYLFRACSTAGPLVMDSPFLVAPLLA